MIDQGDITGSNSIRGTLAMRARMMVIPKTVRGEDFCIAEMLNVSYGPENACTAVYKNASNVRHLYLCNRKD